METAEIREIGYYPIVDGDMIGVAYCDNCWGVDGIAPITEDFEEIGLDSTFGYYHEFDRPVHCYGCQSLIKTSLTKDGQDYVLDTILDPSEWNKYVASWAVAYQPYFVR